MLPQCVDVDTIKGHHITNQRQILVWKNISIYLPFLYFQDGQTALHQAASAGHAETVAALILGGCDIAIQDFVSWLNIFFQIQMKEII